MSTLSPEDRERWLERMREHVERFGPTTYLAAPIVEPNDRFFPDRYTPDLRGVRTVARRLLGYAGLGDLAVDVFGRSSAEVDPLAETLIVLSAADANAVDFGVWALGRPEDVPLVLAHEVARAYRLLRGRSRRAAEHPYRVALREDDDEPAEPDAEEEEDVSLAAFYLGFGLISTLGAHQYRATGELRGMYTVTRWVHRSVGALHPEVACFLLAAQCAVRDPSDDAIEALASSLGANERARFTRYLRELRVDRDALCETLGLPPRSEWPAPPAHTAEPLEDDGWEPREEDVATDPLPNEGRPVFRRRQDRAVLFGVLGGSLGALLSLGAVLVDRSLGGWVLAGAAASAVGGWLLGRSRRAPDLCSDPSCEARLPEDAATCPRCGGTIRGEIGPSEAHLRAVEGLGGVSAFGADVDPRLNESADPRYVELGVACPHCAWIPDGDAHWSCDSCAGEPFDTFATRARCPSCDRAFDETFCPTCGTASPHEFWWPEGS